jgi:hypothetical protein
MPEMRILTKEAYSHCQAAGSLARNQGFGPPIPCFPLLPARLSQNTPPEMPAPDYEGLDWSESDQDEPEATPAANLQDQSKLPRSFGSPSPVDHGRLMLFRTR